MSSPTQRSLEYLRRQGYLAEVVEKRLPKVFITKDLYGFIDILAIRGSETLAVQTTSDAHVADRIAKIRASSALPRVLEAGWRIEVHGWSKPTKTRGRWRLRVETVFVINAVEQQVDAR